jgi:hypothetical protein
VATLPDDWRSIQSRWELWHTIRSFAAIAALAATTISLALGPRVPPVQRDRAQPGAGRGVTRTH